MYHYQSEIIKPSASREKLVHIPRPEGGGKPGVGLLTQSAISQLSQKFWRQVANKSYEQKLWTKVSTKVDNIICQRNNEQNLWTTRLISIVSKPIKVVVVVFVQKLGPKNARSKNYPSSEALFSPSKGHFPWSLFWVRKNIGSEKSLGQKNLVLKKFWV